MKEPFYVFVLTGPYVSELKDYQILPFSETTVSMA